MDSLTVVLIGYISIIMLAIGAIVLFILKRKTKKPTEQIQQPSPSQSFDGPALLDLPIPVLLLSPNGKVSRANKAALTFLKKEEQQLIDLPYQQALILSHTDTSIDVYLPIKGALNGTSNQIVLGTQLTVDTTIMPITGYAVPIPGFTGIVFSDAMAITSAFTMLRDEDESIKTKLSEEKQLTTNLQSQLDAFSGHQQLTSLFTNETPLGLVILNTAGEIQYLNHTAETLLGVFTPDVRNTSYEEIVQLFNQNSERDSSVIKRALSGEKYGEIPHWMFLATKNGKSPITGIVHALSSPQFHGVAFVFMEAFSDFTEQDSQKAFFSAATHDLRTPLTTIRAVLELLAKNIDTSSKEEMKKLLCSANESAMHLISLVNDLLSVARIEQNRVEIKKEAFDIVELTETVMQEQMQTAKNKRLYLSHPHPDMGIPKAYADRLRTEEVLTNLLSNAIKYTHQGGVTLTHKVHDGKIVTMVTDTGTGINKENYRLLFRKFQQVSTARNQLLARSTGLGLFIAKEFAKRMDGDVELEHSEPGEGSTFTVTMPIAPAGM